MNNRLWQIAAVLVMTGLLAAAIATVRHAHAQDESDIAVHMHEHLVRLTDIKSAVLIGDLEAARLSAEWLALHKPFDTLTPMYASFVDSMREDAYVIIEAQDVETAANGVAAIATDCAGCHTALEVNLEFGVDQEPSSWTDLQSHMQRHLWGVDRLWEGLIGPSDAAWSRGIRMLAEAPLKGTENHWGEGDVQEVGDALAVRVHELSMEAASALTPDARASVYAELISACAACHTATGGGPRPD